jgi:hypothetical protein
MLHAAVYTAAPVIYVMEKVRTKCGSCGGTGLYRGFAEPAGVACLNCEGTGCRTIDYEPFTARVDRTDVATVRLSRGTFIGTGVGPAGGSVTYDEFRRGKVPTS